MTGSGPTALSLTAAADALKARVDAWTAAVALVAAAGDDPAEALDDPRLQAAEDEFEAAAREFARAAGTALGLVEPDEGDDSDLEVEELALHLLVGLPEGAPDPARDAAALVHEAGERLVAQLTSAGYEVPAWQFGCEYELLMDDDDDEVDEVDRA